MFPQGTGVKPVLERTRMPSPVTRYTSGTFRNSAGVKIVASNKNPVYAYRRSGKVNKGGWTYTKAGKKSPSFRVSIVRIGSKVLGSDRARGAQNPYPVPPQYRHTGDWIRSGDKVTLSAYPSGRAAPPKKVRGKKPVTYAGKHPRTKKGKIQKGRKRPSEVFDPVVEKAKELKAKAAAEKKAATAAKRAETKKKKAAEAEKLAKKAQAEAKKVIESKSATKSQKDSARATKRAAKKTEASAKKVKSKAAKAAGV